MSTSFLSFNDPDKHASEKEKKRLLQLLLSEEGLGDLYVDTISARDQTKEPTASFAQERLWFLNQWDTESCLYNIPVALHLSGNVQIRYLEQSLNEITRRHEVLRHRFMVENGALKLRIAPVEHFDIPFVRLEHLASTEQEAIIHSLLQMETDQPFDLVEGPLLRPVLVQLGQKEYLFCLVFHHIAFDDWSWGIFLRELSTCYSALCEKKVPQLPTLPIQYTDFSAWQRQRLQGEQLAELRTYWRETLHGTLPLLPLPTDYPRPAIATYEGGQQTLTLSASLSNAIRALSKEEGVTHFMILLTVYAILLYRYTSQEDLLIGSPIVNRDRTELGALIGYFGNMLVLRLGIKGDSTFRAVVKGVQQVCLDAFAHQDFPFEKLVEELHPERSASHTPLFQTVFSLRTDATADIQLKDVQASFYDIARRSARYDLAMELVETENGFVVSLNYKTALFEAATINRMLNHYQELLEDSIMHPLQRVADLSVLTPQEHLQIVEGWNATEAMYPRDKCVHHLFEQKAAQTPQARAILSGDRSFTYFEVNQQANQLAHYLQGLYVGPEVMVGICMERSHSVVVALLGVLKAGGAFLLLDPSYPSERLAFLLQDAHISIVITHQAVQATMTQITIDVDRDWMRITEESDQNPVNATTAENLAYLIYTSGSTGMPKGVMIEHRSLCNRLLAMCDLLQLTPQDCFLQKTPYAFDVAIGELFTPLIAGASLVIARPGGHLDPRYLLDSILSHSITYVHFVPSMLRVFLEQDLSHLQTSRLKHVWCGGEALPLDVQERFFQRVSAKLYNGYGPSEATIGVTCCSCEPTRTVKRVSIGRPIANTFIYILDTALNPVPVGVMGELYIGGIQLARGYLGRTDLTQERFLPNPLRHETGSRMYRTGDFARYLNDGSIEFLGRIDTQVKIRGVRIELAEIEAVLVLHPALKQAIVRAQEDVAGLPYIVAYLVPTDDKSRALDPQEIRSFLLKKLPEYMVPATYITLETLPLLESGKVDVAQLPSAVRTRTATTAYIAPGTRLEREIADIWRDLLGVEHIGIHDNFFDLGGYSLLLFQLQNKLRETMERQLSLLELYQAPTISALANVLRHEKETEPAVLQQDEQRASGQKRSMSRQREILKGKAKI